MKAEELYERLLNKDKILSLNGQIKFYFGNIDIVVKQKDVVGNIIQEWLQAYLDKNNIPYLLNPNSQMPPDFYLNTQDKCKDLLEVKAFNRSASPGFDIADFRMFEEEILEKPWMLHADYLIFGYDMDENGQVTIRDLWLKKVWQITRRMKDWAINLQIKQNVIHKIRPAVWYSNGKTDFNVFENLEDFVSAIEQTVWQNPKTREKSTIWKNRFIENYEKFYGVRLQIPRWDEIKDKYENK